MHVNSSLLGYVFIISGIALAVLAYGIYLNFREGKSKTSPEVHQKDSPGDLEISPPSTTAQKIVAALEDDQTDQNAEILIDKPFTEGKEMPHLSLDLEDPETPIPEKQDLKPVATILREIDSGNLIIRVEDTDYYGVAELMNSTHWSRIERLSTDFVEWMETSQISGIPLKAKSTDVKNNDTQSSAPKSMVEEINQILERKLRTEDVDRKAIKIIEMLDGSVKVYIGVDSYPIDEVPFEDVRELIREAVAEWEGSR